MSLADCLQKFGKSISGRDAQAIQARADELVAGGMDQLQAEIQAVDDHSVTVGAELDSIAQRVEAAGGKIGYDAPALSLAQDQGYEGADTVEASEWSQAVAKGLDMSKDARMQRAKDMGFGVDTVYYHGTGDDFKSFDSTQLGKTTGARSAKKGFFLTDNPQVASDYVDIADEAKGSKVFNAIDRGDFEYSKRKELMDYWRAGEFEKVRDAFPDGSKKDGLINSGSFKFSPNVIPAYVKSSNPYEWDAEGKAYDEALGEQGLSEIINKAVDGGHDGLLIKNFDDSPYRGRSASNHFVIFDPSNIRSVNAAFDPAKAGSSDLLAQSDESKNLFVAHNLSAENILAAFELGGLAAPSLAVAKSGVSDFSGFGEITLLADPSLLESSKVRAFDADIYSPRQPRPVFDINEKQFIAFRDGVEADTGELGWRLPDISELESNGADKLVRSESAQYHWLKSQGKAPSIKKQKVDKDVAKASRLGLNEFELRDDPRFIKMAESRYRGQVEAVREALPDRAEKLESIYFDDGAIKPSQVREFAAIVSRYNKTGGNDLNQLRQDLSKKMRVKANKAAYEQWVSDQFNAVMDGKRLFKGFTNSGNRKYIPYNMENVVKEMTQKLQAGEGHFYGAGSVRSAYANEMKSIKDVQARRDQIVSEADMERIKEESGQVFSDALDKLKPYYKFDAEGWGYAEDAGSAIAEGPGGIREAFNLDDDAKKIIDDLTSYLQALPSSYFEAKAQRSVAFSEFNTAIVPKDINKAALKVLTDAGLKIKKYDPKADGDRARAIGEQEQLLFQEQRGSITLLDGERIIQLAKASDLSTFIHESSHLFLEMEKVFAAEYGVTADQQTILDWLGAKSFDEVIASTPQGVEMHEKFAESFEVYAREGKAPSLALRDAFAAFSRWLTQVYKSLTDSRLARADLNDDIRGVFDRMLATQEEIDRAAGSEAYDQLFRSKEQAGMTDAQWAKYQEVQAKVKAKADATLYEQVVKQLRQRETQEWAAELKPLIDEETERLGKLPVYQIINDLKTNKMDIDAIKEILEIDAIKGRLIGNAKKGGVDPQEYAEIYGYSSTSKMLNDILGAGNLKEAAKEAAQQRMIEKHGDILNDGTIEQLAQEALHNTAKEELLLAEIKAANKGRPAIDRDILKSQAKTLIGSMKYAEVLPNRFYRAEIKAAKKAVTATDSAEILQAKIQQLANHYLYKEALSAREQMTKNRKFVKGVQGRQYDTRLVNPAYVQNMKILANMYEMRQAKDRGAATDQLLQWYMAQVEDPNQYVQLELMDINLIEALASKQGGQDATFIPPGFSDLTGEQLQGVVDMLKHMRYVGGLISQEGKAEFKSMIETLATGIIDNGGKDVDRRMGETPSGKRAMDKTKKLLNRLPSLRNLARMLDGFEDGPAREIIYSLVEDASNRKLDLQTKLFSKYKSEMEGHHKLNISKSGRTEKTITLENGTEWTLTSQGRFMLAMNWGTESNREAIRDGYDVTDADVIRMMETLTKDQLELVNATWRVNESLWPEFSSAAVTMLGAAPPKLDPTPFVVNGVKLSGGHMRLFYSGSQQQFKDERKSGGEIMKVSPSRAGSSYSRVGSGGQEVSLEISNLARSWDDNIHYIAFAEPARKMMGILNSKDVQGAIEQKHGEPFYQSLVETVEGVTGNRKDREKIEAVAAIMQISRRALTAKYLMYNVRNTVQQAVNPILASGEVGVGPYIQASYRFMVDRKNLADMVTSKSSFMRERATLINREAKEYLRDISVSGSAENAWRVFNKLGFTPQTITDSLVAFPAWLAAYEQSMIKHNDEKRAVSDADTAISESIGSGSDLHAGGVYQSNNPEWVKSLTMMGSWMGMIYNRMYKSTRGFTEFGSKEAFKDLIFLPFLVSTLSAAIIMDIPEEEEDVLGWMMSTYGKFLGGTAPILRDVVSAFSGFDASNPIAAVTSAPFELLRETSQLVEGEQGIGRFALDVFSGTITDIIPIPASGNLIRAAKYMQSREEGNEPGSFTPLSAYQAVVEGANKND
jgi:hypothetical protein